MLGKEGEEFVIWNYTLVQSRTAKTLSYFNTLVQSGTKRNSLISSTTVLSGEGTDRFDNPSLINRAKKKAISSAVILALVDVAKEKEATKREQTYWNAYHCQRVIVSHKDKLHGNYCKTRICSICNGIRKAEKIIKYYPVLKEWEEPHFITLTIKSVKEKHLSKYMDAMIRAFRLIKGRCNKRHQRGKGIKLMGIKSLECNFNPKRKTYNPHFHLLVPDKATATLLKKEWLNQWRSDTTIFTVPYAQDIRKVKNLERDLVETIKYGSKVFTDPEVKKGKSNLPPIIYANALDNIIEAMEGKRLFERFGFDLPKQNKVSPKYSEAATCEKWVYSSASSDWINPITGELLTGYSMPNELQYLLSDCIDCSLM